MHPIEPPLIALMTDFGLEDAYVGMMKGVIAGIAPQAHVIDLTHAIPPGDVRTAAFRVWQSARHLPVGTILVCVVDPGVGTSRRAVVLAWPERICIGPDNGLFTYLLACSGTPQIVELANPNYQLEHVSRTFHGRDIFAPAAAYIAAGIALEAFGPPVHDLLEIPLPRLELDSGLIVRGEILLVDRFGNLVTSIGALRRGENELAFKPWLGQCPAARLPGKGLRLRLPSGVSVPLGKTFGDVLPGHPVVYIGSDDLLEIAVNAGHAANQLTLSPGQEIALGVEG